MNIDELITELKTIQSKGFDPEHNHYEADQLLLKFIGNKEVSDIFNDIDKWYA